MREGRVMLVLEGSHLVRYPENEKGREERRY